MAPQDALSTAADRKVSDPRGMTPKSWGMSTQGPVAPLGNQMVETGTAIANVRQAGRGLHHNSDKTVLNTPSTVPSTAGTMRGGGKASNTRRGNGTNVRGSPGFSNSARVPAAAGGTTSRPSGSGANGDQGDVLKVRVAVPNGLPGGSPTTNSSSVASPMGEVKQEDTSWVDKLLDSSFLDD